MPYTPPALKPKWYPAFEASMPSLEGKVVLITGTTSGTGNVAARFCAKHNATVVCLNRPSERSAKALASLTEEFPEGKIHQIDIDLMDFDAVRKCAEEVKAKFDMVDVICCNAGVMALEDKATKDGYDVQMQTNHLSHFLLVKELYPLLQAAEKANGEARVVTHSSEARNAPPSKLKAKYFQQLGGKLGGNGSGMLTGGRWQRYHQTKLANAVFTSALAKKLKEKGSTIKSCSAHPGLAATELQATTNKDGGMGSIFSRMLMKFSQSKEDGAMGIIKGIADPSATSGELYGPGGLTGATGRPKKCKIGKYVTPQAEAILWEESEKACGEFVV